MRTHLAALALLSLSVGSAHAQAHNPPDDWQIAGTIGPYRVGLDLIVDDAKVQSGHYFYISQLKDIPVRAVRDGGAPLTLVGTDASIFRLHFVGNGSEHGAPLDFDNSVGLAGTWVRGTKTLPVTLNFGGISGSGVPDHRYALITKAPDEVVEAKARQFLHGVLTGDRDVAAAAVDYPLQVNGAAHSHLTIRDKAALLAHWNSIFTPTVLAELKTAVPHDMFVRDQGAMVAQGVVWFQAGGASSINTDVPG